MYQGELSSKGSMLMNCSPDSHENKYILLTFSRKHLNLILCGVILICKIVDSKQFNYIIFFFLFQHLPIQKMMMK